MLWIVPGKRAMRWGSPPWYLSSIALKIKNTSKIKPLSPLSISSGCLNSTAKDLVSTHTQSAIEMYQAPTHTFLFFILCPHIMIIIQWWSSYALEWKILSLIQEVFISRLILSQSASRQYYCTRWNTRWNLDFKFSRVLPQGQYSMKKRNFFFRVLPPPGQYSTKLKTFYFSSIAPKNDVIQGQYSKRAILEGQYSRGNTRGLMHKILCRRI